MSSDILGARPKTYAFADAVPCLCAVTLGDAVIVAQALSCVTLNVGPLLSRRSPGLQHSCYIEWKGKKNSPTSHSFQCKIGGCFSSASGNWMSPTVRARALAWDELATPEFGSRARERERLESAGGSGDSKQELRARLLLAISLTIGIGNAASRRASCAHMQNPRCAAFYVALNTVIKLSRFTVLCDSS